MVVVMPEAPVTASEVALIPADVMAPVKFDVVATDKDCAATFPVVETAASEVFPDTLSEPADSALVTEAEFSVARPLVEIVLKDALDATEIVELNVAAPERVSVAA